MPWQRPRDSEHPWFSGAVESLFPLLPATSCSFTGNTEWKHDWQGLAFQWDFSLQQTHSKAEMDRLPGTQVRASMVVTTPLVH